LTEKNDTREDDFEDEIKPEDGLVRHWMFFNGEGFRLFAALAAAICGVLRCFLYILGAGQSAFGIVLLILAIISFGAWRSLDRQLREYKESGWKKDKHSRERDKNEIRIAIILWLFIFMSIGAIMLSQWRHAR
jgi:hypothetical protein